MHTRKINLDPKNLYYKIDGEFVKVGHEFSGWPADGIWIVKDGRKSCILKIGDIADDRELQLLSLYGIDRLIDTITEELLEWQKGEPTSISEIAQRIATKVYDLVEAKSKNK